MTRKIAIIGAGISGLAAAHRLSELKKQNNLDLEYRIFESSSRAGGTIETESRDGFLLEKGPDSFLSEKPWALDLCKRLGIDQEIIGTQNENRRTFVVRGGKLIPLPEGFYMIAPVNMGEFFKTPLFSWPGKIRMAAEMFIPPRRSDEDESIASFILRRFGREALDRVGQPMLAGVYSGDPEKLSLLKTMPRFRDLEKEYGSVIKGLMKRSRKTPQASSASGPRYSLFLSFEKGMQTLTDALVSKVPDECLYTERPVERLSKQSGVSKWIVESSGDRYEADAVCICVSAATAGRLLQEAEPGLASRLRSIAYESVATLHFAYDEKQIRHGRQGFGFVVPQTENSSLMACTFVDKKYQGRAPKGRALLRAFSGGAYGKAALAKDDASLTTSVQKDLKSLLGIQGEPLFASLKRYPQAMPQYGLNHDEIVKYVADRRAVTSGLYFTGSAYRGSGIPDCIRDAEETAGAMCLTK